MLGTVYKIANKDESIVYIGSTAHSLQTRWRRHTNQFKIWAKGNCGGCSIYRHFLEHGVEAFSITPLSTHEFDQTYQLREFEQLAIDRTACVNEYKAYISPEDARSAKNAHARQYRIANSERVKEYARTRITCECGSTTTNSNVAAHRRTNKHLNFSSQELLDQLQAFYQQQILHPPQLPLIQLLN